MTLHIIHLEWRQDGPWPSKWSQNWPFYRFSWRNQPIMRAYSLQIASNEKPIMSESLGGNELTHTPFKMTSGWCMTCKMEPKWTILQVVFFRNQPIMRANCHSNGLIWKAKCVWESRGNDFEYGPFRMTSGKPMTLKMEPKLTVLQVFSEQPINNVGP